jgi:LacI family transcriptional regulator
MSTTKTIGIVLPHDQAMTLPYYSRAIQAIKQVTSRQGFDCGLYTENEIIKKTGAAIGSGPKPLTCDGVIVISPFHDWDRYLEVLVSWGISCILIRRKTTVKGVITIHDSDFKGTYLAMEHLYALGHRTIGYIGRWSNSILFERRDAYCQFLKEKGLAFDKSVMYEKLRPTGPNDSDNEWELSLRAWVKQILAQPHPPTAFFCHSDNEAVYFINQVWMCGKRIPQDIAVVAFDNGLFSVNARPPLTSVHLPIEEMCEEACNIIIEQRQGKLPSADIEFPNRLVIRESCGYRLAQLGI